MTPSHKPPIPATSTFAFSTIIFSTIVFIAFIFIAGCHSAGTDSASSLFDGQSLKGWHTYGKSAPGSAWNVDGGSIHLQPGERNGYQTAGGGDLVSDEAFGNF